MTKTYSVFQHQGRFCNIVEKSLAKDQAIERCEELNIQEQENNKGSGHFFTTDANDCEVCGKQPCQCEAE